MIDNIRKYWVIIGFLCCFSVYASDLGIMGQVYPIQEEDFLEFIMHRIAGMQSSGEWQKIESEFSQRVKIHVDRPKAISGIKKCIQNRSWNHDPSIMVPHDFYDTTGRVLAKAGTTINPLKYVTLHKVLIFFDGDDQQQVAWAENMHQKLLGSAKLILVRGSISDQVKRFHQPIYFDQEGKLVNKFNISNVPAMVKQEGLHLKVSEVLL